MSRAGGQSPDGQHPGTGDTGAPGGGVGVEPGEGGEAAVEVVSPDLHGASYSGSW